MTKKIAIQGYEGCFHQAAAQQFFGTDIRIVACPTFREVVRCTADPVIADAGIMAIENSIAGSILPNYELLQKSGLKITGEVYLHIRQHLLVNKGVTLDAIQEVHSHPMALLQCLGYLEQHPWRLVETEDTALSARRLQQQQSRHIAAIAGSLAAELYGLEIIAPDIHTLTQNYTRFLVLDRPDRAAIPADADKASVCFQTDHTRGSLAAVLSRIAAAGINLSKLQSSPIPGSWRYSFHADMEFEQPEQFRQAMAAVATVTTALEVHGIYRKGLM